MKKYFLFLLLIFIFPFVPVDATSVSNIDMDVYIMNNGDAIITEVWDAYVDGGTEGYHPYYNLGSTEISNLEVSMDGKKYEIDSYWDVDKSLEEKAYKAGIYNAGNGEYDICFGLTNYGSHKYTVRYQMSDFVASLNDADMVYWNLFPKNFSASPDNVSIKVHSDFRYEDTLDVWGYGKSGAPCYVYNGVIEMTSDDEMVGSSEYLTLLVKFPKGTFSTNNVIDEDFDYFKDMADEGAINYNDEGSSTLGSIISFILQFILDFGIFIIALIFSLFGAVKRNSKKVDVRFGSAGNKVSKDVNPFRDIPCNKDIYRAYFISTYYNLNTKKEDLLGAIILKWLQNGNVKIEKIEKQKIFSTKEESTIVFDNKPVDCCTLESNLYAWMFEASKDGRLESNELKKWCSNNYSKIYKWFDDILEFECKMLVNEGKAKFEEEVKFGFVKSYFYRVDDSIMEDANQLAGLKKFLKEFSVINQREAIEVYLWNEYLIFAQIFGIADKVASQFKKLYPEIAEDMNNYGYNYDDISFIYLISSDGIRSASAAKSRAESYSSGGGGFSAGGGGGGSFGGGGGGGGFR